MRLENPKIPEGINTSPDHPLKEFVWLLGGVVLVIVIAVGVLSLMAQFLAARVPFRYETELASYFQDSTAERSEIGDYLQEIADRLARAQSLPADMHVTVHFADESVVNAFATLGGHIVIYRGLIEKMPSENALAMVISHEVAHIKHRDPIVALGRGAVIGIALAALAGISAESIAETVVGKAGLLTALTFSREQESRADATALAALVAVYGHAAGATDVFNLFADIRNENLVHMPVFLSTHPDPQNRIESIEQQIVQHGWSTDEAIRPLLQLKFDGDS